MISKTIDGRRLNVFYFGEKIMKKESALLWYDEMKAKMEADGIEASHISLLSKDKPLGYIRTRKRTEKRYLNIVRNNYSTSKALNIMSIEPNTKELSSLFYMDASISLCNEIKNITLVGHLIFDFSIKDKIDISKYIDIMRKYIIWDTEDIFETEPSYHPLNYLNLKKGRSTLECEMKKGFKLLKITKCNEI